MANGAILTAATLSGTAVSGVSLTDPNVISDLGSFGVSSGAFALNDSGLPGGFASGDLTVSGLVSATSVTITGAPTITVSGTISGAGVSLASGIRGIHLMDASELVSGGTVDLSTTGGGVTQVAGGTIDAGTLLSSGSIVGAAILQGTANLIGTISGVSVAGTLTVVDNETLALVGLVGAEPAGRSIFRHSPAA